MQRPTMIQLKSALKRLTPAALLLLAACDNQSGPVEIKYDRDACEMCGMIISSPRYATEVRLASDGKAHKFDDIGDALNWLEKECKGLAQAKEIWVMDSGDGKTWLDARQAFFRRGASPMNYNFAAVASPGEGAVDFAAMRAQALKPRYACPTQANKDQ
jgi:copper chaperone NosL